MQNNKQISTLQFNKQILDKSKFITDPAKEYVADLIEENYMKNWHPKTSVFITAPTGTGKNYFIEERLIPDAFKDKKNILILSNRIALSRQIKTRIAKKLDALDSNLQLVKSLEKYTQKGLDDFTIFGNVAIMSYHKFKDEPFDTNLFNFVIIDECHFFLSDAIFNKYTAQIFDKLENLFYTSTRIYMTATPDEIILPILQREIHHANQRFNQNKSFPNFVQDLTRAKTPALVYSLKPNHNYICHYLQAPKSAKDKTTIYKPIVQLIEKQILQESKTTRIEKWLIFVSNKETGQALVDLIGQDYAVFLTKESKNSKGTDHTTLEEIVSNESFSKKVLISTSVLDNGINIKDKDLKHIVISTFDKVAFLQMLGRVRRKKNCKDPLNLYIPEYTSHSINYIYQNTCAKLARIYKATNVNNHYEILTDIFKQDDLFFVTQRNIPLPFIGYNEFCKLKLETNLKFLTKFQRTEKNLQMIIPYLNQL